MTSRLEVAIRKHLDGFTLDVEWSAGDGVAALFGPSGAGKTLTLQCLAGLVRPDSGRIVMGGEVLFDSAAGVDVPPQRRRLGYVFQGYALFPHLTVRSNVGFGLRGRDRAGRRRREDEVLARLGLEALAERYPRELSGGQRQRVALARALAASPRILLLDEPFGALDARVRQELRRWLRRLHDELHVTSVFVTHDQEEAFEVSDRVVLMNAGRIEQAGTPAQVFEEPASPFVMRFLGAVNVFQGRLDGERAWLHDVELAAPNRSGRGGAHVFVRPHEIEIHRAPVQGSFAARVERIVPLGAATRVELTAPAHRGTVEVELDARRSEVLGLAPGDDVHLTPRRVRVFPAAAEEDSLTASAL
jgi:sulfate transport system ATP-binding protein